MPVKIISFRSCNLRKLFIVCVISGLIIFCGTIKHLNNPANIIELALNTDHLRYGTYVEFVNETCLSQNCIYNKSSPDIWASEKILVTPRKFLGNGNNYKTYNQSSDELLAIKEKKRSHEILLTPPIITLWAYELGYALSEVFERHGVGYTLDGGSALGAERHKGMIPWDDDLDIAIHEDYESLLINEVAADLYVNYSIAWKEDNSADYKFYHTDNSLVIPDEKNKENPWKYPFADIFIYQEHPDLHILTYRNKWRNIKNNINGGKYPGEVGFDPMVKWPNGTKLIDFGEYKMRVTTDNAKYLAERIAPNWYEAGVSPWYNHYTNRLKKVVEFDIPPDLYNPTSISTIMANASSKYITYNFGRYSYMYEKENLPQSLFARVAAYFHSLW